MIVFSACLSLQAQRGAYVHPANLDYLAQQAEIILRGHIVSARVEPHPQFSSLQTVVVTLKVDKVIKGKADSTHTFRQFIWDLRDSADAAGYRKADELLLFLNPASEYGLTSPVGLEQGRFRIVRDAQGNAFAVNGRGNAGLFSQVQEKAATRGITFSSPVQKMMTARPEKAPLAVFEGAVRVLAGASP
ncbi:MAG: hypothetical protein LAN71_09805 [Acidobacteriia bacterium]|nr:hypothetical protein [Terriglobia bacterium]